MAELCFDKRYPPSLLWTEMTSSWCMQVLSGFYSVGPYFCAEALCDILPIRIFPPVTFVLILAG